MLLRNHQGPRSKLSQAGAMAAVVAREEDRSQVSTEVIPQQQHTLLDNNCGSSFYEILSLVSLLAIPADSRDVCHPHA